MAKSFAVLGMGRFGRSVAQTLYESGAEVMIVDRSPEIINQCASFANQAIITDLEDEEAVKNLALNKFDVVIVAIATDLHTSILAVLMAKEAGASFVIAKAANKRMGTILEKVGADKIVYPEEETGIRMAKSLVSRNFIDYYNLTDDVCLLEIKVRPEWVGKNLIELNLRKTANINVIASKENGIFDYHIDPTRKLQPDTILFVISSLDDANAIL